MDTQGNSSEQPPSVETRIAQILNGRDRRYSDAYHRAQSAVVKRATPSEVEKWCESIAGLLEASLSLRAIALFFDLSERWPQRPVQDLLIIGAGINRIGRHAGNGAMEAVTRALGDHFERLSTSSQLSTVVGSIERLAREAPESTAAVSARLGWLLQKVDAAGLEDWITVGLRTHSGRTARSAYFSLEDAQSLILLQDNSGEDDFSRLEKRLKMGLSAIWDRQPAFRRLNAARRTSLVGDSLGFPRRFLEAPGDAANALYWAAMAHAGAHMKYSRGPYPVGSLKPLQIAIISALEDARVELLATQEMPGLARLWRRYHRAQANGASTISDLLARLSRALIDPAYVDEHPWIVKGRRLFEDVRTKPDDPLTCREIGGLLGNDLGQMRLQFDAKNYVVEPAYRDDNLGLWDFESQPDAPTEEIETMSESVRIQEKQEDDGRKKQESTENPEQKAKSRGVTYDDGVVIATYPEWDHTQGRLRPEWVTVREIEPLMTARAQPLAADGLVETVTKVVRASSIGRKKRLKGLREGDSIDIDAGIEAAIDRRSGRHTDGRIFQRSDRGHRDLAVLLLLDISRSTSEVDRHGRSVLDVEREAAVIMAGALEKAGDSLAIHGFNSDGREKVRYLRLKEFGNTFGLAEQRRLASLKGEYSTRLGAAVRHAGKLLSTQRAFRRVLLVLTDGEPADIDVKDIGYLTEDARHAVAEVRHSGMDVFAFGLGAGPFQSLSRITGRKRVLLVPKIDFLPARILQLYGELKK